MIGDAIAYAHIHKPDISIQKSSDDQASLFKKSYIKFRLRCRGNRCQTLENHRKLIENFKRKN